MTVLDVLHRWRETERVFKNYDSLAGECICCRALFETLEQVAKRYRLDLEDLVKDLENQVESGEIQRP